MSTCKNTTKLGKKTRRDRGSDFCILKVGKWFKISDTFASINSYTSLFLNNLHIYVCVCVCVCVFVCVCVCLCVCVCVCMYVYGIGWSENYEKR